MSVTGWKSPGTIDTEAVATGSDWTNPSYAASSNDQDATCAVAKNSKPSYWLRCSNFGFTTTDIPSGSTIDGIEVDVECAAEATSAIQDTDFRLVDASGRVGNNGALAGTWGVSDAYRTHGGSVNTWGAGLEDTDVRASTFGVHFYVTNISSTNYNAYVDHVRIRVYYTAGATSLTVNNLGHSVTSTIPNLTQKHNLTNQNLSHGVASTSPTLIEKYTLALNNLSNSHAMTVPTLVEKQSVTLQQLSHAHASDNITVTVKHILTNQNLTHSHELTSPTLDAGSANLVVANISHSQIMTNITLSELIDLIMQNLSQGNSCDNVSLTQNHYLDNQNLNHAVTYTSPVLSEGGDLVVQNCSHGHACTTPSLSEISDLLLQNLAHSQEVENVDISQLHNLLVNNLSHLHSCDVVVLTSMSTIRVLMGWPEEIIQISIGMRP